MQYCITKLVLQYCSFIKTRRCNPVDNRPYIDKFHHFIRKNIKKIHMTSDIWNMTSDTWHVTYNRWHMTCDTWKVGEVDLLSKFQLPSFYGLGVKVFWRYVHKGSLTDWLNSFIMNDKGVCRTAPATQGLLNISIKRCTRSLSSPEFYWRCVWTRQGSPVDNRPSHD